MIQRIKAAYGFIGEFPVFYSSYSYIAEEFMRMQYKNWLYHFCVTVNQVNVVVFDGP